ncbi:MAG: DUF3240 family protein [Pseudomonadota bacterium]
MFHPATKVTIIAEQLLQDKLIDAIEAAGAKGYTIVDGSGKGQHLTRASDRAVIVSDFSIIRIEAIMADDAQAHALATDVRDRFFTQQSGIVYLSQIEIIERERF